MNRKVEGRGKELCHNFKIILQVGSYMRKRLVADILGGLGALMTSKNPSEPHFAILLIYILREHVAARSWPVRAEDETVLLSNGIKLEFLKTSA